MKKQKIAMFLLLIAVSITLIGNVYALNYTSDKKYFEKNSTHVIQLTTPLNWYSSVTATEKTNSPIVNTRAQNKVLFIWNQGANYDITINQINVQYLITWTQTQEYATKITWKQTNSSASMMATFRAFN